MLAVAFGCLLFRASGGVRRCLLFVFRFWRHSLVVLGLNGRLRPRATTGRPALTSYSYTAYGYEAKPNSKTIKQIQQRSARIKSLPAVKNTLYLQKAASAAALDALRTLH